MNRSELESKHLAELHALAAEAGVERYRLLSRAELIERLSGEAAAPERGGERRAEPSRRRPRERERRRRE
ncbi:MAG TPA: Rho termination factor N-terminal domain-containing protein, partial [Solirubrobacterales bacterium]